MTKRCFICRQPITNTPYHHMWGNTNRCQKHCNCSECDPPTNVEPAIVSPTEDEGPVLGVLATELISDALSSPDPSPDPTPDPTPDFGGFGGGESGGGGASGDF